MLRKVWLVANLVAGLAVAILVTCVPRSLGIHWFKELAILACGALTLAMGFRGSRVGLLQILTWSGLSIIAVLPWAMMLFLPGGAVVAALVKVGAFLGILRLNVKSLSTAQPIRAIEA